MKNQILTFAAFFVLLFVVPFAAKAQDAPPQETGKREADLLELVKLDNTIKLDVRYARTDNFVGKIVYPEARAFLQRPAAEALLRVHQKLKKQKLGLMIFDGYRPWAITKLFWEVTPEDKRKFVANPATGSRHNRGCAVDLSIYDLQTGKLVPMPSDFDEFSDRASPAYKGGTKTEIKNRDLLRKLMEAEGFTVNSNEWWHFDYKDWKEYAIYDIAFSEIEDLDARLSAAKIEERRNWKRFFDDADVTGGILLYDLRQNKFLTNDVSRIDKGFVPASTSKIFHALVFLENGAVKDENEILKWDGVTRAVPEWNKDQTLRSAVKVSAVWVFVELSKRVGRERMQEFYNAANYGNRSTNGFGADYWNTGDLRITQREQINFLVRLYESRLPFSQRSIDTVKEIITNEKTDDYVLRAKTGWSDSFKPSVGWFVGYVTRGADAYFFALEIDIKKDADAAKRGEIAKSILRELKIIE